MNLKSYRIKRRLVRPDVDEGGEYGEDRGLYHEKTGHYDGGHMLHTNIIVTGDHSNTHQNLSARMY